MRTPRLKGGGSNESAAPGIEEVADALPPPADPLPVPAFHATDEGEDALPAPPPFRSNEEPDEQIPDPARLKGSFEDIATGQVDFERVDVAKLNERGLLRSIYNPATMPCRGMKSFPHPASLQDGEFNLLQNLRIEDFGLVTRGGAKAQTSGEGSTDVIKGAAILSVNGVQFAIVARQTAGAGLVDVYIMVISGSGSIGPTTWVQITSASGKYGNTRLSASTEFVNFAVVKESDAYTTGTTIPSNREYIVINNGIDYPRIYDPSGGGGVDNMAIHSEIEAPDFAPTRSNFTWAQFVTIATLVGSSSGTATFTNPTAGQGAISIFPTSATPGNLVRWPFASLVMANSEILAAEQFHIVYKCDGEPFPWTKVKVRLQRDTVGTYNYVLHTPAIIADEEWMDPVVVALGGDYYLAAFSTAQIYSDTPAYLGYLKNLGDNITGIAIEWYGEGGTASPAVQTSITMIGIGISGAIQAGASFGLTHYNEGSKAESRGRIARNAGGARLAVVGGASKFEHLRLPENPGLYYSYELRRARPEVSNTVNRGLSHALWYMKRYGSQEFNLLAPSITGLWNSATSSWKEAGLKGQIAITYVQLDEAQLRTMPDAYHLPILPAGSMISAGNRLFLGDVGETVNATNRGDVWFSEEKQPFRFRRFVRFLDANVPDLTSPSRIAFSGETVQGFARVSGGVLGADGVLIFTDRSVWAVDGIDSFQLSRPRRVVPHGTKSPRSIAEHRDAVYWLDTEQQIRSLSTGFYGVSVGRVEDKLRDIVPARIKYVAGAIYRDRYYLGYSRNSFTDTSNLAMLIYDIKRDAWMMDVLADGLSADVLIGGLAGDKTRLIGFMKNGRLWEGELTNFHRDYGTTASSGTLMELAIKTREYTDQFWRYVTIGQVGIVCDEVSSTDLRTRRFVRGGLATAYPPQWPDQSYIGNLRLYNADSPLPTMVWNWDHNISGTYFDSNQPQIPGATGVGIYVHIDGSILGNTAIHSLMMKYEETGKDGGTTPA